MNITIHIERLILDGLPVTSHDAAVVQAAVAGELSRLLSQGGITPSLRSGADLHHLRADTLSLHGNVRPVAIGNQIAFAIHKGIGNTNAAASAGTAVPQRPGAM